MSGNRRDDVTVDQNIVDAIMAYRPKLVASIATSMQGRLHRDFSPEDVANEVILDAITTKDLPTERTQLHDYLRLAGLHRFIDYGQRATAQKRDMARRDDQSGPSGMRAVGDFESPDDTPISILSKKELLRELHQTLGSLALNQARAVELHFLSGYTLQRTAEEMGTTLNAVMGLVHRGLMTLRELMSADADKHRMEP